MYLSWQYIEALLAPMSAPTEKVPQTITVALEPRDHAHNPASTTSTIGGDDSTVAVRYDRYIDGGITATLLDVRPSGTVIRHYDRATVGKCAECDSLTGWRFGLVGVRDVDWVCQIHVPTPQVTASE